MLRNTRLKQNGNNCTASPILILLPCRSPHPRTTAVPCVQNSHLEGGTPFHNGNPHLRLSPERPLTSLYPLPASLVRFPEFCWPSPPRAFLMFYKVSDRIREFSGQSSAENEAVRELLGQKRHSRKLCKSDRARVDTRTCRSLRHDSYVERAMVMHTCASDFAGIYLRFGARADSSSRHHCLAIPDGDLCKNSEVIKITHIPKSLISWMNFSVFWPRSQSPPSNMLDQFAAADAPHALLATLRTAAISYPVLGIPSEPKVEAQEVFSPLPL